MPLFKINNQKVTKLPPSPISKEREIQRLFEANLHEILNIDFLASEYSTNEGGRIDTLGIDKSGSPCIIEYKKGQNDTVIMQGLSYLKWLLGHKGDFEILCQKKGIKTKVEWDTPRVICIAEGYNKFDLDTVEILPIKIELLEYVIYDTNILQLNLEKQQKFKIGTSKLYKNTKKDKVDRLQKIYSVEDHLSGTKDEIKKLFFEIREMITTLDNDIVEEPKKLYIAYKLATNFVDIEIRSKDIKIFLNIPVGHLKDKLGLARDVSKTGHWGNGDYEVKITPKSDLEPIFELIKQSYEYNK